MSRIIDLEKYKQEAIECEIKNIEKETVLIMDNLSDVEKQEIEEFEAHFNTLSEDEKHNMITDMLSFIPSKTLSDNQIVRNGIKRQSQHEFTE